MSAAAVEVERTRSTADILESDEARVLLENAQRAGSVSAEEIAIALDELDLDAAQLDEVFHALEELQIEVVAAQEADEAAEAAVREISTDSLQLFLKDIGKVDLLTATT